MSATPPTPATPRPYPEPTQADHDAMFASVVWFREDCPKELVAKINAEVKEEAVVDVTHATHPYNIQMQIVSINTQRIQQHTKQRTHNRTQEIRQEERSTRGEEGRRTNDRGGE